MPGSVKNIMSIKEYNYKMWKIANIESSVIDIVPFKTYNWFKTFQVRMKRSVNELPKHALLL